MVYNFLCKDEKTRRNIYLLLLKASVWKEVRHFFRTVYPNRNHMTTHPDYVNSVSNFHSVLYQKAIDDSMRLKLIGISIKERSCFGKN